LKPIPQTLAHFIETAINRYLGLDAAAKLAMSSLAGNTIEVRLRDVGVNFYLCATEDGVKVVNHCDAEAGTTMTASILSLARMGVAADRADSMFSGDVKIEGDASLGQQFHDVLKSVQIDWEEIISTYSGDIVAHQLGNSIRALTQWGKNTLQTLSLDTTEYLQEESRQLPTSLEIRTFLNDVDRIRLDVDRAEARVKRLLTVGKSPSDKGLVDSHMELPVGGEKIGSRPRKKTKNPANSGTSPSGTRKP